MRITRRSVLQASLWTPLAHAQTEHVTRLHREALVINAHDHMWRREDYQQMIQGGVTAKIYKPMTDGMYFDAHNRRVFPGDNFDWTAKYLEQIGQVEELGGTIIRTLADLEAAKRTGSPGVILGNEGTLPLAGKTANLDMLYARGMRELALYWPAGRATRHVVNEKGRLTPFALAVIENANRLGIAVDSSHLTGLPAFDEVLKASAKPLIHSHGAARFPRAWTVAEGDLDDPQIRRLADSGSVIGLHFCTYIKNLNAWNRAPRIEDLLDHVDYLVNTGGVDCVAIGADHFPYNRRPLAAPFRQDGVTFIEDRDWGETFVEGIADISGMPLFTRGLVSRGYSDEHVRKILGLNIVRVLREVWRS
jgi:membrane dipeptidase